METGPSIAIDPFSGRLVIVAPGRAARPEDDTAEAGPCPFCPGNERETPLEVMALRAADGTANAPGWSVRVFPNKYPAVGDAEVHELFVETPVHERALHELDAAQVAAVVRAWRDRLRAAYARSGIVWGLIFKNNGREAGATRRHAHSQLLALAVVPAEAQREAARAAAHLAATGACLTCDELASEERDGARVIIANDAFAAFASRAPRLPFEVWIAPRRHQASFADLDDDDAGQLARLLVALLAALAAEHGSPPYNLVVADPPAAASPAAARHWRVDVIPRLVPGGGVEWGSGLSIVAVTPDAVAASLRKNMR